MIDMVTPQKKKRGRIITPAVIRISLAWVNDEITLAEATRKLDLTTASHSYIAIARALKEHMRKNGNS